MGMKANGVLTLAACGSLLAGALLHFVFGTDADMIVVAAPDTIAISRFQAPESASIESPKREDVATGSTRTKLLSGRGAFTPKRATESPIDERTLSIEVVLSDGTQGKDVSLWLVDVSREKNAPVGFTAERPKYISRWLRSNSRGLGTFEHVPVGRWRVWAQDRFDMYHPSEVIDAREESESIERRVVISVPDDTFSIEGVVVTAGGAPVPTPVVSIVTSGVEFRGGIQTSMDGRFVIRSDREIEDAKVYASSRKDPFMQAMVAGVRGGEHDLVLKLEPPRWVTFDVWGAGECLNSTAKFSLVVDREDGEQRFDQERTVLLESGSRSRWRLPPDPFRVVVNQPGFHAATSARYLPESVGEIIRIDLEPLPRVRVRVFTNGSPLTDVRLSMDGAYYLHGPDAEGVVELACYETGVTRIEAMHSSLGRLRSDEVRLPTRGSINVLMEYSEVGTLTGTVLLPERDGTDHKFGLSLIRDRYTERVSAMIDPDGTFAIPDLGAGTWSVSLAEASKVPTSIDWNWLVQSDVDLDELDEDEWISTDLEWELNDEVLPLGSYTVQVVSGGSTNVALDFRAAPACVLNGEIQVHEPDGWNFRSRLSGQESSTEVTLSRASDSSFQSSSEIVDDQFVLNAREPGAYQVVGLAKLARGSWLTFSRDVDLFEGENDLSLVLDVARIKVRLKRNLSWSGMCPSGKRA